jgi:hypothetical protein
LPADSNHFDLREQATGGKLNHLNWSVGMELDHLPHRQGRRVEPSFWTNQPFVDALSLLDDALGKDRPTPCGDDHADEVLSLSAELGYVPMIIDPDEFVTLSNHGNMKLRSAVVRTMILPPEERKQATIVRENEPTILRFEQIRDLAAQWEFVPSE